MLLNLLEGFIFGIVFLFFLKMAGIHISSNIAELISFKSLKLFKFVLTSLITTVVLLMLFSVYNLQDLSMLTLDVKIIKFYFLNSLLGGTAFGLSWAYLKMCPMTCFASDNNSKSLIAIMGMFFGAVIYKNTNSNFESSFHLGFSTLPGLLNQKIVIIYIFLFIFLLTALYTVSKITKKNSLTDWLVPGVGIGAIVFYGLVNDKYIGISSAIYSTYIFFERSLSQSANLNQLPDTIIWKTGFTMSLLFYFFYNIDFKNLVHNFKISELKKINAHLVFLSGVGLSFGGLLAGGCTTGAILSGLPTLSLMSWSSSLIIFLSAHFFMKLLTR